MACTALIAGGNVGEQHAPGTWLEQQVSVQQRHAVSGVSGSWNHKGQYIIGGTINPTCLGLSAEVVSGPDGGEVGLRRDQLLGALV